MDKEDKSFLLFILILAFVLRLAFVFFPPGASLFSDMKDYHDAAWALLQKGSFGPATRPPLYPLFLAFIYRLTDSPFIYLRIAQAILGTSVCLFVYGIGFRLGGERAARFSALLVACYPSLLIYTNLVMSENLFIFFLLAGLWFLLRGGEGGKTMWPAAGILLGLACLTRSVLIGFIPLAALWLWSRREWRAAALFLLAAFLTIAPWTARNCLYYHRFVPIDTYGGYNFLIGNNPEATGRQDLDVLAKLGKTYWKEWKDEAHRAAVGYREGVKFIIRHPRRFLRVGVKKIGYLYGLEIRELSWGYSRDYFGAVPPALLIPIAAAVIIAFPVLCLLALGGFCFCDTGFYRPRGGWALLVLLILYITAAHFIAFGESRFHLPLVPALALFAGRLACRGEGGLPRRGMRLRLILFIVLLALLSVNWGLHLMENSRRLATVLGPGGNTAELKY